MNRQEPCWYKIIILLIAAICTFFLLLRWYNFIKGRLCLLGGPADRQLPNEGMNLEDQPPQLQTQGLSPAVVHALPAVQLRKMKDVEAGWIDCDCAVCLGEFEDGEWLRQLPICGHVFHISCVDTWFQIRSNCPLCRSSVV